MAASTLAPPFVQDRGDVTVGDHTFILQIVTDDHPLMNDVFQFWYDTFLSEQAFECTSRQHERTVAHRTPNGSHCILAMNGPECCGSLVVSFKDQSPSEFEFQYVHLIGKATYAAFSRLVVGSNYRKVGLTPVLLRAGLDFALEFGSCDVALTTCIPPLLPFFYTHGFKKVRSEVVHHSPGVSGYLLKASVAKATKLGQDMKRVEAGEKGVKAKYRALQVLAHLRADFDFTNLVGPSKPERRSSQMGWTRGADLTLQKAAGIL